jgi:hypothetical protein
MIYTSPNIIHVIKSRRMGWAGYVAHVGVEESFVQKQMNMAMNLQIL